MGKHWVKTRKKKTKSIWRPVLRNCASQLKCQEELANRAGISQNTIVILESGRLNTTIATCFDIAKALGIRSHELFEF